MMRGLHCSIWILVCGVLCGSAAWTQPRAPLQESLDVQIPVAPQRVDVGGQARLVYELHLTNLLGVDVILSRVQVTDSATGLPVVDLNGPALRAALSLPGAGNDAGRARLADGMRGVVYLWATLSPERQSLERITHRIEYDVLRTSGPAPSVSVTGEVAVHRAALPVLGPSLRGGPWVALYDPAMMGGHRTTIYTLAGRARIPARFAIDWILLDQQGNAAHGDAGKIANWHGYGADVLAVADALVVEAHDDVENRESIGESQGSMALEYASGNYVVLDLGNSMHAFYEHLQQGTLRVKRGDRVVAGQVIARVGNTGSSSSGPHLHFHVADGSATLAAEGQPYVFNELEVVGAYRSIEAAVAAKPWDDARAKGGRRTRELPDANVVVMFR